MFHTVGKLPEAGIDKRDEVDVAIASTCEDSTPQPRGAICTLEFCQKFFGRAAKCLKSLASPTGFEPVSPP
jgi:hypothetical protein